MRLTFLSHTAMGGPFVVGSHQLAKALARRGNSIVHISAPLSPAHLGIAMRDPHARLRWRRWLTDGATSEAVREVVPLTVLPWSLLRQSMRGWKIYSGCMFESPWRRLSLQSLQSSDCVLIDEPRFVGLLDALRDVPIIYRATDLYAQQRNDPAIEAAERVICARADVLLATSEPVAAHLTRLSNREAPILTNGVEFEHFSEPQAGTRDRELIPLGSRSSRAVYVGAFDSRFGSQAFVNAVSALREVSFVLVGPGSKELADRLGASNVVGMGPQPYQVLPSILRECSVGLLPLSAAPENLGRSPMKLYEYLAAGLTVAASSTEELRRRSLPATSLADCDADFPSAVTAAFSMARQPARLAEARACARAQSWSAKAVEIEELAADALARPVPTERVTACH